MLPWYGRSPDRLATILVLIMEGEAASLKTGTNKRLLLGVGDFGGYGETWPET